MRIRATPGARGLRVLSRPDRDMAGGLAPPPNPASRKYWGRSKRKREWGGPGPSACETLAPRVAAPRALRSAYLLVR